MRGTTTPTDRLDLRRDPELISPPTLTTPHIACQQRVHVRSFLPGAEIEVRVRDAGGTVITTVTVVGGWPEPDGALADVGFALAEGQLVDARQTHDGRVSGWSTATAVLSIEAAFPLGLPRPVITPAPTLDCGVRVGVGNLAVDFEVTVTNSVHGDVAHGAIYRNDVCGFNVSTPNGTGDVITARATFCGRDTEVSAPVTTEPAPSPLATPIIEGAVDGAQQITIGAIHNGAVVHVSVQGAAVGSWPCFGGRLVVTLPGALATNDEVRATQSLCSGQPPSPPGTTTTQPCSALPPPIPESAQRGDTSITISNAHPSGIVEVYADGQKIGEGAGSVIALTQPLEGGQSLALISRVGACTSTLAWTLDVACVDPPVVPDPASIDVFPIGWTEVGSDTLTVSLGLPAPGYSGVRIKGLFSYPAATDGQGADPHPAFAAGTAPLALLIHGRHRAASPSHLGYRQLQATLARQGIASLSVDHQDLQGQNVNDGDNILARARLAAFALALMAGDLAGRGPGFERPASASILDLDRIGVMGHSRGGDAAVLLQHVVPSAGFDVTLPGRIRSVLPLAPTTFGTVDDPHDFRPVDVDVLVVLPAQDGDVRTTPGQKHYDLARVPRLRTQLLVDESNHNRYNTVWWDDHVSGAQLEDTNGLGLPLMSVHEHQRLLTSYGAGFFQRTLLGLTGPEVILTGRGRPAGVRTDKVRMCHSIVPASVVDTFEDANLLANDLGQANTVDAAFSAVWLPSVDDPTQLPVNPRSEYFGETGRLRASSSSPTTDFFHLQVGRALDRTAQIWVRAAEDHVAGADAHADPLEFFVGLDPGNGMTWVSSNGVGGMIPVVGPIVRRSVFVTFRFPLACFTDQDELGVREIVLRTNAGRRRERRFVFDDVEIVEGLA
jgi:hypothetical protein